MAKYAWSLGATSKTILVFMMDSSSTTGAGKVSISAGSLNAQAIRVQTNNTVTIATISVTNLAALTDAYALGGWFPVDSTNAPGWYRFDVPDFLLSTGAVTAAVSLRDIGANNIAPNTLEIQLEPTPSNVVQWTNTSVTSGNIALWTTVSAANVTSWAGAATAATDVALWDSISTANVTQWAGVATAATDVALWDSISTANVTQWTGTSVTTANIALWTSVSAANVTAWTGASVTTANIALWQTVSTANITQWSGASVTTNNIALWTTISGANVTRWAGVTTSASDQAIQNAGSTNVNVVQWNGVSVSTNNIVLWSTISQANVTQWRGVTTSASDLAIANSIAGSTDVNVVRWNGVTVSSSDIAIKNTLAKGTDITGFNDLSQGTLSSVVFGSTMTEAYAADGAAFTIPQALYQIWAFLGDFSISGASYVSRRLDGATTAMTHSLNDATTPTGITRIS